MSCDPGPWHRNRATRLIELNSVASLLLSLASVLPSTTCFDISDMSDNTPDTKAELGPESPDASTCGVSHALAALESLDLQPQIEQDDWDNLDPKDVHYRFVALQYANQPHEHDIPRVFKRPVSDTSSMAAVSNYTNSTRTDDYPSVFRSPSDKTPSLGFSSSVSTKPFPRTDRADSFLQRPEILEEGDGGVLQLPTPPPEGRLQCCFHFLACPFRSDDLHEWDIHCLSHFESKDPPTKLRCPFQCDWSTNAARGSAAWRARFVHIFNEHQEDDNIDTEKRPDESVLQHLWRLDIIDDTQLKELRTKGRLSGHSFFVREHGSRRNDRRRVRRER